MSSIIASVVKRADPVILELGAHHGEDTQQFLDEFPACRLFCFEPDPRCIAGFKKRIADPRCTLIEAAVGAVDGETVLHQSDGSGKHRGYDYSSTIMRPVNNPAPHDWLVFSTTVLVKVVTLDTWVKAQGLQKIDFIWSDVQGAEREMISGARETLKITDYVYTEYGETEVYPEAMTMEETLRVMAGHDFHLVEGTPRPEWNLLFKRGQAGEVGVR